MEHASQAFEGCYNGRKTTTGTQGRQCEGHQCPESQPRSVTVFLPAWELAMISCLNHLICPSKATLTPFQFVLPYLPSQQYLFRMVCCFSITEISDFLLLSLFHLQCSLIHFPIIDKIQGRFHDTWKLHKIQFLVSTNTVLLEYSHIHYFTYCLGLSSHYNGRAEQ